MSSSKSDIIIAIVGGGLGGLCASIILGRAGYSVHLFEQAPEFDPITMRKFSEIGAGVSIGPNSVRALEMIGPDVANKFEHIADVDDDGAIWFRVMKWDDGQHITDINAKGRNSSVHRAHLLEALLPMVPPNVKTHFSQHVVAVENLSAGAARLTMMPSQRHHHPDYPGATTTFEAHAVIGCDGVKSAVRGSLGVGDGPDDLGDAPAAGGVVGGGSAESAPKGSTGGGRVRYTGTYAYRGLLDMEAAVRENGEIARVPALWVAPGKHILAFPIEHGNILNLVAFISDRSRGADERTWTGPWVKPVGKEKMLGDFQGWDEAPRNLLKLIQKPEQWALHELVPLDKWTVGRVTLLGDAAHASLPHNGAGAGQAIEDAYVLGQLLSMDDCTKETLPAFLQAYEDVRRPRASRQQVHSRESGEFYELTGPVGDDFEKLGAELRTRYDWIWTHDLTKDVEIAKSHLKENGLLKV